MLKKINWIFFSLFHISHHHNNVCVYYLADHVYRSILVCGWHRAKDTIYIHQRRFKQCDIWTHNFVLMLTIVNYFKLSEKWVTFIFFILISHLHFKYKIDFCFTQRTNLQVQTRNECRYIWGFRFVQLRMRRWENQW